MLAEEFAENNSQNHSESKRQIEDICSTCGKEIFSIRIVVGKRKYCYWCYMAKK